MNELQDINEQMSRIANLARAYANATPEQRNNVNRKDIQAQLDRYNELKARRNELYAEQEARVQAELEAQRQAQQQVNTRGTWRRANNNVVINNEPEPKPNDIPHDYSKDQSFVPGMSYRTDLNVNSWLPDYDARYDVNSPNYVYNKWWYNISWEYIVNPEYQNTYGYYDAWGRLIPQDTLKERQAYQDTLNMPWEKITWLNNMDLLTAATPMAWEIVNSIRWLKNIPVVFTRWWTTPAWSLWQVNNYLGQANNYLWRVNNFLTENPWVTYNNIQRARKTYDVLTAPALSNNVTTPAVQYVSPILNSVSSAYRPVSLF